MHVGQNWADDDDTGAHADERIFHAGARRGAEVVLVPRKSHGRNGRATARDLVRRLQIRHKGGVRQAPSLALDRDQDAQGVHARLLHGQSPVRQGKGDR